MPRLLPWMLALGLLSLAYAALPVRDDQFGALRALKPEATIPAAFEDGEFKPRTSETLAFLGGTNVVDQQFTQDFELLATIAWPEANLKFRNLGWQADTIYRQQRPLYFYDPDHADSKPGSSPDQRERTPAGTVFLRFGKMESLDGPDALPAFRDAYMGFLRELQTLTGRIVLVTPTPFFETGPAAHLAAPRNAVLETYVEVIRELADSDNAILLDLFSSIPPAAELSTNGVHLSSEGHKRVAFEMMNGLGAEMEIASLESKKAATLRALIARKNDLWLQYFRPTNWAFLYGDRQHVPSSRDHEDSEKRWFPYELDRTLQMVAETEVAISANAAESTP